MKSNIIRIITTTIIIITQTLLPPVVSGAAALGVLFTSLFTGVVTGVVVTGVVVTVLLAAGFALLGVIGATAFADIANMLNPGLSASK